MVGPPPNQDGYASPRALPKSYNTNNNNLIRSHAVQSNNYPEWLTSTFRRNLGIARLSSTSTYRRSSSLLSRPALSPPKVSNSITTRPHRSKERVPIPSHIVPTKGSHSRRSFRSISSSPTPSRPPTPLPQPPTMNLKKSLSSSGSNTEPVLSASPSKQRKKPSESSTATALTTPPSTSAGVLPVAAQRSASYYQRSLSSMRALPSTGERNRTLRLHMEKAIKEHKIFTIMGAFPSIRRSLLRRGWVEKNLAVSTVRSLTEYRAFLSGSESGTRTYAEESEHAWISRVLRDYPSDFIWTHRRDAISWTTLQPHQIINRHPRASFTSKVGIAACLQNLHWFAESNISATFFPRCYRLCVDEEKTAFINDFRLSACMCLLKWIVGAYEKSKDEGIMDPQSHIPATIADFAIKKIQIYSRFRRHEDLDSPVANTNNATNQSWDSFLKQYYAIVMEGHRMGPVNANDSGSARYEAAKKALKRIAPYWPQFGIDGINNVWICKPGARSRGNGIVLMNQLDRILGLLLHSNYREANWVAQKYIERPLLVYKTKFDIRQWFVVTDWNPLTVWCYKESYIRFCSKPFSLLDFHESVHLTNNAVQARYQNSEVRDTALPSENMWDNYTFQAYLQHIGKPDVWDKVIYPGMKQGILGVLLASQETADFRKNSFELYGADFMLSEDFTPWMIEVNASPCMSSTTSVTARMCGQCLEDLIKVVIDQRNDRHANTGLFELIYKQQHSTMPYSLYNGNSASGMEFTIYGNQVGQDIDWSSKFSKSRSRQKLTSTVNLTALNRGKSSSSIPMAITLAELMNRIKLSDLNGFVTAPQGPESSIPMSVLSHSRSKIQTPNNQLSKSKSTEKSIALKKSVEKVPPAPVVHSIDQPRTTRSSAGIDAMKTNHNGELPVLQDSFKADVKSSAESLIETEQGEKLNLVKFSLPSKLGKKRKKI